MEEKKINKLMIPLTIRSASILSAFTIMTTTIGGCTPKKNGKTEQPNTTATNISSDFTEETTSNVDEILTSSSQIEETTVEEENTQTSINGESSSNHNNTITSKTTNNQDPTSSSHNNNTTTNEPSSNQNSTSSSEEPNITSNDTQTVYRFIPLTPDNINNVPIFERAVLETAKNTRGGFGGVWDYYYKEQTYTSYGIPTEEFTYILSYLNRDYLNDDTLAKLLGKYSQEDLKKFTHILEALINFVKDAETTNDWNGLIIDNDIANQLTNIEKAYIEYRYNNNRELLENLVLNNDYDNPFIGYYLGYAGTILTQNLPDPDKQIANLSYSLYFDKMEESENQAILMYNRSHGKQKIIE